MARRSAGTGARTPTASPPGARPAGPCRSGPAPARPPWRPSAARATTTDVGSVGLDVAPPPGRRLLVGMARSRRPRVIALDDRHSYCQRDAMSMTKDVRLKTRVGPAEKSLLERAAPATRSRVSALVVQAAAGRAPTVLADPPLIDFGSEAAAAF